MNRRIAAIVRGVRRVGVPRQEITTSEISIVRMGRRESKGAPLRVFFRASASLRVSDEGLERLGRAIDVTSSRGATGIFGPRLSFTPALRATGRQRAEAGALEDARVRAEAAAAATNQRIVGVRSIDLDPGERGFETLSESVAAVPPAAGEGQTRAPTRIFAGRRTSRAEARVTYTIEPTS